MSSRAREHFRRVVFALFGGGVMTVAAAVFETMSARAVGDLDAPFTGSFAITLGLLAPLGLVTSVFIAAAVAVLSPDSPASFSLWMEKLRGLGDKRQADLAAFVPLAVIAGFAWMTTSAHVARAILSMSVSAGLAGIGVTAGSLAVGLCLAISTLAAVPVLRRALARLSATRRWSVDPVVTGGFAVALAVALFAAGVASGTVSGEGGALGIYGIFKRPELDLRAPAELFAIAVGAVVAPSFARPPRTPSTSTLLLLAIVSFSPVALFVRDATALNAEPAITEAIERGEPLGKLSLATARKLTDRDHDGVSGLFGGGDCNDHDPRINPFATEILDDGIDQDCSGADLTRVEVAALAPVAPAAKVDDSAVAKDLNIVLVTVDTLRADLGYAGYPKAITPNLDALAARATVFEHAYSLASYTGKSVGPLLIGKYCSETHRNWGHFNKFGTDDTFVTERLHAAGFRTMSVQGHRYFEGSGFERGFDVMDLSAAPPKDARWDQASTSTSEQLTDAALSLLGKEENTKGRFFLWVHYLDPHADYLHHDGFDFGDDERGKYDGEIAFTDKHLGRLFDAIAKAPWGARTAIILTSDHGETFGEHGMSHHGFEVWEPLVHVPFVVYVPGAKPHRISARRSAIDLVPTILDIAKLPTPPGEDAVSGDAPNDFVSGVSLLSDVFPAPGATAADRDVLVDMPAGPYNDARRAYFHDDLKLIVANEVRFDLYDVAKDPAEATNLSGDRARFKEMKARYAAMKARLREIEVTATHHP